MSFLFSSIGASVCLLLSSPPFLPSGPPVFCFCPLAVSAYTSFAETVSSPPFRYCPLTRLEAGLSFGHSRHCARCGGREGRRAAFTWDALDQRAGPVICILIGTPAAHTRQVWRSRASLSRPEDGQHVTVPRGPQCQMGVLYPAHPCSLFQMKIALCVRAQGSALPGSLLRVLSQGTLLSRNVHCSSL